MALAPRIALFVLLLASSAPAQLVPEIEPNSLKSEATFVLLSPPGTSITGTTTGSISLPGDTSITSVDTFRIQTPPLAPGIYRHSFTLNIGKGHPVPAPSIRGLDQTGTIGIGGVTGTNDVELQSPTTGVFPTCAWYGFGKQEEVLYRLTGNASTTIPYSAYWIQTSVTPTVIAPVLESSSPITIQTTGDTNDDTEIVLYDATFTPVPSALNDDEYQGATTQSRLTRILPAGTYYLGIGFRGLASDQNAAADDDSVTGGLTDFPDCVVPRYVSMQRDWDFRIVASNGTHVQPNTGTSLIDPTLVTWFRFTTAPGAPIFPPPPANDACANAGFLSASFTTFGTLLGATNDATPSCDPGGTASRDVWYRFTNPLSVTSVCRLTTCQGDATDVTLSAFAGCGLAELACNDDCAGGPCGAPRACLTLILAAHQTAWIRVGDKGLGGALFGLTLDDSPYTPPNDSCANPVPMSPGLASHVDTLGATTGPEGQNEAACNLPGGPAIVQDLWYTWTSSWNGQVAVQTCGGFTSSGSGQDSKIAVYQGAGCPNGPAIACSEDSTAAQCSPTENAWTSFTAVCGETYTIQVGMSPNATTPLLGAFGVGGDGGTLCGSTVNTYCRGDLPSAPCPCGNFGSTLSGCASSVYSSGALLVSTGAASTTNDTCVLTAQNAAGPCLFFQGTGITVNSWRGDGLLCTGGTIVRLGVGFPTNGIARLPNASTPTPLHVLGGVQTGLRYYQGWYRSFPALCAGGAFNLTSGVSFSWFP